MCAKFGCGPTVVSKKKGGVVQTDRQREPAAIIDRSQYVCINDTSSECMNVTCGVSQGSILALHCLFYITIIYVYFRHIK